MENSTNEQNEDKKERVQSTPGVAYPIETIHDMIESAKQIVAEHGTGKPISKEAISKTVGKAESSLSQWFSTFVQYGIFNLMHGKGYVPTDLYRKYMHPVHNDDEKKYKMEMLRNPPLYSKIIENLNNHQLPLDVSRFANLLKDEPYNLSVRAAERAAKVFLDNARSLNLLDSINTLRINSNEHTGSHKHKEDQEKNSPTPPLKESDLFELPIPLPNKRKAYLRYPIDDLSKRDIQVIKKAIDFIASSIEDYEEEKPAKVDILE